MNKIKNVYRTILIIITSILLVGILSCVILAVLNRTVFKVSMFWTEELARIIFIWFVFLSMAISIIDESYFEMKFFYHKMFKGKVEKVVWILIAVLIAAAMVFYAVWAIKLVIAVLPQQLPTIRASMAFMYSAVPAGMCLSIIAFVIKIIEKISSLKSQDAEKNLLEE